MIITLCRRGLLKIYASFCELNISFCKTLTFRFADYTKKIMISTTLSYWTMKNIKPANDEL